MAPRDDRSSTRPTTGAPRREWAPRDDRSSSRPTTDRTDRPAYVRRDDRGSSTDRRPSTDRAAYDRPRRDEQTSTRPRHEPNRDWAPRDKRVTREPSNTRWERDDRGGQERGQEAEAERMEADSWTKSSRHAISDSPVEVAADNGFTALGLPERLVERLARDGITTPFPIQTATIPDALAGRDVLGRGQTGSGKTLAYGLPTLTRLLAEAPRSAPRRPRALVLVPTRELAMQVSDALEPLVHVMGLTHKLVAGGLSYTTQINALNRGVDLLIATPGRLNDLIERGAVELRDIRVIILDEADHMAEMGFLQEIGAILDGIPEGGQRLLFSATLDRGIDTIVQRYLTDPVTHSTDDAKASVTTMEHHVLLIDPMHKKVITAEVANREGRTLVFMRTKLGADRVALQLREQGVMAAALHGGLNQGARNRVLGAFRDGTLPVLVATDVAARGIHVDDVSVVLQVDPPADHKDYLHRSGRTARAGDRGTVVTLALPHQRKGMERQLLEAGVDAVPTKAVPGDAVLAATGATPPSGIPVPEESFRRLLEGPPKKSFGGSRGPRSGAKGGFRPHHGGPSRGSGDGRREGRPEHRSSR
nr:DEAD/DEAH box helicase [Lapillicoccus sp.]